MLILDEPTAGLDPIQIVEIRKFLEELRDDHAIILSSHILAEIEKVADRIMIIRKGSLVADGTVDDLCGKARTSMFITLEAQASPVAVKEALGGVDGVRDVETTAADGWCRATSEPRDGQDIRPALFKKIAEHDWPTRSFSMRKSTLEDYYQQVFREMDKAEKASQ
mgnify:FL=1